MANPPFGFNGPQPDDDRPDDDNSDKSPQPSFGFGFGGMQFPAGMQLPEGMQFPGGQMPGDLNALMPMLQQIQQMLSGSSDGGPVNWELAKQTAVQAARQTEKGARTTLEDVLQAVRIADLWLDGTSTFPSGVQTTAAWTRSEWVSRTLGVWAQLCDPVAAKMVAAMTALMPEEGIPGMPQVAGMPGIEKILESMGGMMFGSQFGQAIAHLSTEVLTSTDIGLPLAPRGTAVLVTQNVDELAESLQHDVEEVRLYLALREAAYLRLFSHVPWLHKKVQSTIEAYASGIAIDRDAIDRALSDISPEDFQANPEKIQEIMASGIFEPQQTDAQRQQLAALETLLALIEGWVDRVVAAAASGRLPGADKLRETMRRRRASGGPAEQTFSTLVGLELRPRRLRDAAAMWERIEQAEGVDGRDRLWEHPDLLPTSEDFAPAQLSADEPQLTDADFEALLASDGSGGPTENLAGGISPADPGDPRPGESRSEDDQGDGPGDAPAR